LSFWRLATIRPVIENRKRKTGMKENVTTIRSSACASTIVLRDWFRRRHNPETDNTTWRNNQSDVGLLFLLGAKLSAPIPSEKKDANDTRQTTDDGPRLLRAEGQRKEMRDRSISLVGVGEVEKNKRQINPTTSNRFVAQKFDMITSETMGKRSLEAMGQQQDEEKERQEDLQPMVCNFFASSSKIGLPTRGCLRGPHSSRAIRCRLRYSLLSALTSRTSTVAAVAPTAVAMATRCAPAVGDRSSPC